MKSVTLKADASNLNMELTSLISQLHNHRPFHFSPTHFLLLVFLSLQYVGGPRPHPLARPPTQPVPPPPSKSACLPPARLPIYTQQHKWSGVAICSQQNHAGLSLYWFLIYAFAIVFVSCVNWFAGRWWICLSILCFILYMYLHFTFIAAFPSHCVVIAVSFLDFRLCLVNFLPFCC